MGRYSLAVILLFAFVLALLTSPAVGQGEPDRIPALPFPADVDWLNVAGPLDWDMLRGKVVVLDFWTYGCINCIHILPDLKRLEDEFSDTLVVIGVHSAKFENEKDTGNIRQILQRYEIAHPVVNDRDFRIWNAWGIRAWPTVMLIDPEGYVVGYHEGEGVYNVLQPVIADLIATFDTAGKIARAPLPMAADVVARPESGLAFPGKVLADEAGRRLFIADSNHHRIVVVALDTYEVLAVIGEGVAGHADGRYDSARFDTPQGMALGADGRILYVADTGNHMLRAVDLVSETVTTVAGTGQQGRGQLRSGRATSVALNSPWDVMRVGDILYVAMAGAHQLWRYDVVTGEIAVHSGSGRENLLDGPHADAALAQPSGITADGAVLYFADSEASAVRAADSDPGGGVRTIVGTGLFDFGDRDGVGGAALLQHPLGVAYGDGLLYVADTYNNKIKQIDPLSREVRTLAGQAPGGYRDGRAEEALFDEPGGLSYAAGRLYVADTNNHAIRVIDLATRMVSSVIFANPEALLAKRSGTSSVTPVSGDEVVLAGQTIAPGNGTLTLRIDLPEDYKINDLATSSVTWWADGTVAVIEAVAATQTITDAARTITTPVVFAVGETTLTAQAMIFYCEAVNETLCFVAQPKIVLPIRVQPESTEHDLTIAYAVQPPLPGWAD
ncbi:MAG: redoxin domain-containing protein [Anaerolineae bacterium]|nr:redoxin domain-containing protein [Anaerolineae bacterium]